MTLQLTPGKAVVANHPRNAYVLFVELMHGDADDYSTIKFGPFAPGNTEDLEATLRIVEATRELNRTDWNNAESRYPAIPGWEDHIGEEWLKDNEHMDDLAKYESHHIRFFDEQGQEHEVSYVLT
jgi:hypothetical protein